MDEPKAVIVGGSMSPDYTGSNVAPARSPAAPPRRTGHFPLGRFAPGSLSSASVKTPQMLPLECQCVMTRQDVKA